MNTSPDSLPGKILQKDNRIPLLIYIVALALILITFVSSWYLVRRHHLGQFQDDAYISFRYAANWAAGKGLVFNMGERVEGYTNFLYVVILGIAHKLGIDPEITANTVGLLSGAAAIVVTWLIARHLLHHSVIVSLSVGMMLSLSLPFVYWSTGGLETNLFTFLVMLSLYVIGGEASSCKRQQRQFVLGCIGLALASLTRPEGVVIFALVLGYIVVRAYLGYTNLRALGAGLASYTAIVGTHFAWRLWYYGYPFPNTFYVKVGATSAQIRRGELYVYDFVTKNGGLILWSIVAVLSLYFAWKTLRLRENAFSLLLWMFVAIFVGYTTFVGGDAFLLHRFLVPILPAMFLLLANVLVMMVGYVFPSGERRREIAIGILISLLGIFQFMAYRSEWPSIQWHALSMQRRIALAEWLLENASPDSTIACYAVGAIPYYSGLRTIDMLGIVDEYIAHKKMPSMGSGRAGQDKYDIDYVLSRQPDYITAGTTQARAASLSPARLAKQTTYSPVHRELLESEEFWVNYEWVPINDREISNALFRRKAPALTSP